MMRHSFAGCILAALVFALFAKAPARADDLSDLDFLLGNWESADGAGMRGQWFPPAGSVLPGFFYWPQADGREVLEVLTFHWAAGTIYFQTRHFGADLTAWEAEANIYRVTGIDGQCAHMELADPEAAGPRYVSACRLDAETLEFSGGAEAQPEPPGFVFRFRAAD